jgi:hypothetical protein
VIAVVVCAVPERKQLVNDLLSRLDAEAQVCWDREHAGVVANWLACARAALATSCTSALLLQDDLQVCRDLVAACRRIEAVKPADIVTLYASRAEVTRAVESGSHWAPLNVFLNAQAMLWPRRHLIAFVDWLTTGPGASKPQDSADRLMQWWLREQRLKVWATAPSLVDHRRVRSALGHGGNNRVARVFLGEDRSALEVDWTAGLNGVKRRALAPASGMVPRMTKREIDFFTAHLRETDRYFEFGVGGSTLLAWQLGVPAIFGVDTSAEWISRVLNQIEDDSRGLVVRLRHVDIGPVGAWGFPLARRPNPGWSQFPRSILDAPDADLVLIDGRFRVACFLHSLLACKPGTRILMHDYIYRSGHYRVADSFAPVEELVKSLALFRVPANVDAERVNAALETYRHVLL